MDTLYSFLPFVFSSSSSPGSYVEALILRTPPDNLLSTHGRIFGLFEFTYPEAFHLDQVGKEMLPYFERMYYDTHCFSVHEHLIATLKDTQLRLEKRTIEYGSGDTIRFSFCMGVVWGSALYIAKCGSLGVRLYRGNTFGSLFEIDNHHGSEPIVSLSGTLESNDTLVLYSQSVSDSTFPVSLESLSRADQSMAYSRLGSSFLESLKSEATACVTGIYVDIEAVPSVEDEHLLLSEVSDSDVTPIEVAADSKLVEEQMALVDEEEYIVQEEVKTLFASPVAVHNLRSKVLSSTFLHRGQVFTYVRPAVSFFTRQRVFILGCMLLLLFFGFIVAGRNFEQSIKQERTTETVKKDVLPKLEESYKQGLFYAELNPDRAKDYLKEARGLIAQLDDFTKQDPDVQKLTREIDSAYAVVTKTYDLGTLTHYFDLSTVNAKATGTKIAVHRDALLISDTVNTAVYQVGTNSRSAAPLIGPSDLENLVSAEGDDVSVFAVSRKGIVRTALDDSSVVSLLEGQSIWGSLSDMQVFGGNVYLLDIANNQIWKYLPEGSGFGTVRNYLAADSKMDFSNALSFAIDGNVWVSKESGEVLKLVQGEREAFEPIGLEEPLKSARAVYTDTDMDYLYILDSVSGKVVVVQKRDGSYVATYTAAAFKGAKDLVVDATNKQLYVLVDQKIYKSDLREEVKKE